MPFPALMVLGIKESSLMNIVLGLEVRMIVCVCTVP